MVKVDPWFHMASERAREREGMASVSTQIGENVDTNTSWPDHTYSHGGVESDEVLDDMSLTPRFA